MKIKEVTDFLAKLYPIYLQENYDNCGLQIGDETNNITGVLVALDCTEEIIEEAIETHCNLIVVHHPLLFKGIKRIGVESSIERIIHTCIKKEICVYAIHTNLDNHLEGVNAKIASKIGLTNLQILNPKSSLLFKLQIYVPNENVDEFHSALTKAGAGKIGNYSECSFRLKGTGTFTPMEGSNPILGEIGIPENIEETQLSYLIDSMQVNEILTIMNEAHPYEEVAYEIIPIGNKHQCYGSGMIGILQNPIDELTFLKNLKKEFNCGTIRHTELLNKTIKTVAICGGSGVFLLETAIAKKADVFISADFKYHDFFNAENKILIADIGHYESEQFTSSIIVEKIQEKFSTFAVRLTGIDTNPVNYL